MDRIKNDEYYLNNIRYHFDRINNVMKDVTYEMYAQSEDKQDITMFNLIQISENAQQLSNDYKKFKSDIPWSDVYGLRNRIVHDYGNVILDIVYDTLKKDIPDLYHQLFEEK